MTKQIILIVFGAMVALIMLGLMTYRKNQRKMSIVVPSDSVVKHVDGGIVATQSGLLEKMDKKGKSKVAIYNGTKRIGITGKFAEEITTKIKANIVLKENAVKRDYPRSFVVDINGKGIDMAKSLAYMLDCPLVSIMPDGEVIPSAEILVVLGEDYK